MITEPIYSKLLEQNYKITPGGLLFESGVLYTGQECLFIKGTDDKTKKVIHEVKEILDGELIGVTQKRSKQNGLTARNS